MDRASRAALAVGAVLVVVALGPSPAAQDRAQPAPELYHWVLPVDQPGVEVATLHPNDCYVVQAADGVAYFGAPTPAMSELQRQLVISIAHPVERIDDHAECTRRGCREVEKVAARWSERWRPPTAARHERLTIVPRQRTRSTAAPTPMWGRTSGNSFVMRPSSE